MRKFLITMMCIIMVVCFMPTVAMAETTSNCSGSCGHVAEIGTTHYDTLQAAIDAVGEDGTETTIKLVGNITGISTVGIGVGKAIILDLNGHTIEAAVRSDNQSKHYYAIDNYGQFTLKDTSIEQTGSITARGIENLGDGVMTIESGKIIAQDSNGGACIWNEANLIIKGGIFRTYYEGTPSDQSGPACVINQSNLTITGGQFNSVNRRTYAIVSDNGTVKIDPAEGKEVIVSGAHGGLGIDGGIALVNGGFFSSSEYYGLYVSNDGYGIDPMTAAVTVNGGTFSGANYSAWIGSDYNNPVNSTIEINGGEFKKPLNAQSCTREGAISIKGGTFSGLSALDYLGKNANVTVKLDGPVNESITIPSGKKVTLDLNGQRITSTDESAVIVSKDSSLVVEDMSNGKTGSINGATVGIKMGNAPENGQDANSFLTINGGTISGGAFGISGNGNRHGTTIIVNNGNITGVATGIYHPQDGELTVKGGTITGRTGIEIRSGKLTVEGGTITGTATPAESTANENGTTTDGAGIAVAQHTTKKPINVIVKGGTIEGYSALYQSNPQNNPPEDVANVSIQVEGGNFNAINQGRLAVYSQNKTGFITGGTFSTNPTDYVPANSRYYVSQEGGKFVVRYSTPTITLPPTTPTDNVTNSGSTATDNASTNADLSGSTSTSNGTTTATVDKTTADKIVDKAVENKSTEVVIDATANTTTATNSTTVAQVTIPTETLGAIAEKTEADVTIKTDVAEVKMDNAAAAAVSEQATGDTVQIVAEKVAEETDKVEFELKVVCSDGKVISNFNGGNIAVTVALPKAMAEKKVVCVYIDDNGHMSKVEGQKNADGTYTFVTGHFSSYAILSEEEADAAIAAQKEAIKNIEIKLTSKQVKTKSGKKGIKITWTAAAGDKTLDGVEVFRSKERYKGYGTEPFYTSTKGGNEGSYINTKSLKKGTKYYYRVRGYVLVDGQKVYTDYSTKAWRTFK